MGLVNLYEEPTSKTKSSLKSTNYKVGNFVAFKGRAGNNRIGEIIGNVKNSYPIKYLSMSSYKKGNIVNKLNKNGNPITTSINSNRIVKNTKLNSPKNAYSKGNIVEFKGREGNNRIGEILVNEPNSAYEIKYFSKSKYNKNGTKKVAKNPNGSNYKAYISKKNITNILNI